MTGSLVHVVHRLAGKRGGTARSRREILNSQMDVARTTCRAIGQSPATAHRHGRIRDALRLNGHYLVEKAGEEGLVKITVRLEQDMDAPVPRHFGWWRTGGGERMIHLSRFLTAPWKVRATGAQQASL